MKSYSPAHSFSRIDSAIRDFRLRDLEMLVAVNRLGSLRLAAREMRLDSGRASRLIKSFEKRIGKTLFQRSPNGLKPTAAGKNFAETIQAIIDQARISSDIGSQSPSTSKTYGISTHNYLAQNLLPQVLGEVLDSRKEVKFRIIELFSDEMLLPGLRGAFEICLHVGHINWPETWESIDLGTIEWGFFIRARHPLLVNKKRNSKHVRVEDAVKYPFLLPFDFSFETGFRFRHDRSPIAPNSRHFGLELQRADVAAQILLHTDQIAHLPTLATANLLNENRLKRIFFPNIAPVLVPLILTVKTQEVSKSVFDAIVKSIKKKLMDKCATSTDSQTAFDNKL